MPVYENVPTVEYYYNPEPRIRSLLEPLNIRSILDVGAGHGGVFDFGYWTERDMEAREACDIFWMRDMGEKWKTRIGVDACQLTSHYPEKSFDFVQCCEVLEHIEDNRKALEEMCKVARKAVFITSADESQHRGPEQAAIEKFNTAQKYIGQPKIADLIELGFDTRVEHLERKQIIAWKFL